jgi:hypothetical protein
MTLSLNRYAKMSLIKVCPIDAQCLLHHSATVPQHHSATVPQCHNTTVPQCHSATLDIFFNKFNHFLNRRSKREYSSSSSVDLYLEMIFYPNSKQSNMNALRT